MSHRDDLQTVQGGARAVELMHLAFLQVLTATVDPSTYVLKGGANLRLFYSSPRRSQDIDLDALESEDWSLEERVDKVLASKVFGDFLRLADISITAPRKPKQTPTTRRWKFTVAAPGGLLNTKIEFSARHHADPEFELDTLTPALGRDLGLKAIRVQHYLPPAAIRQKISALAQRAQTEPRDVFDLDLLLARFPTALRRGEVEADVVAKAIEAAFRVDFAAFDDLVVRYLEDDYVDVYRRPEVWDEMVLKVTEALGRLR